MGATCDGVLVVVSTSCVMGQIQEAAIVGNDGQEESPEEESNDIMIIIRTTQ